MQPSEFSTAAAARAAAARAARGGVARALDSNETSADLLNVLDSFVLGRSVEVRLRHAVLEEDPLPSEVVRACLLRWLRIWEDGGRANVIKLDYLPILTGEESDIELVTATHACLRSLAAATGGHFTDLALEAPGTLAHVAELVADRTALAVELLLYAAQLELEPQAAAAYAAKGGRLASAAGEHRMLAQASCVRALALSGLGLTDHEAVGLPEGVSHLTVFDAVDAALRHLSEPGVYEEPAWKALTQVRRKSPFLDELDPCFVGARAAGNRTPERLAATQKLLTQAIWDLPSVDSLINAMGPLSIATSVEEARSQEEPVHSAATLHADWASWSFDHPAYQHAVPHGTSVLRERRADSVQLELQHEIQHILSMIGGVGLAVTALRAAVMELEIELWAMSEEKAEDMPLEEMVHRAAAPLVRSNLATLVLAEQSAEFLAKMQILQDIWNSWFEGIAVFGELADSSTDQISSHMADILTQRVDVAPPEDRTKVKAAFARARSEAEQRYTVALGRLGTTRLRGYLDAYGPKYVAGYLTVRSVVSRWRRSCGSLSASQAQRLLLHLTRFSTLDEGVPNLSLPLAEFTQAAEEAMLRWVGGIAALDAESILFGGSTSAMFGWTNLRVDRRDTTTEDSRFVQIFEERVRQALGSLAGAKRVPAGPSWAEVQRSWAVDAAQRDRKLYLASTLLKAQLSQLSVLPLGQSSARFWLNRGTGHLVYVVRTTEERADNGRQSYDMAALPLKEDEFDRLLDAVARNPYDRMTIARFADLEPPDLPTNGAFPGRGYGRNVLAFRLGAWSYIQPRGWLFTSKAVDPSLAIAVQHRLTPTPILRMEARLLSAGGGAAKRTAEWTATPEEWAGMHEVPVGQWVRQVYDLAVSVRDHSGEDVERQVAIRLLSTVVGDRELANRLVSRGIAALAPYDPAARDAIHQVLSASAQEPAVSAALDPYASDHPLRRVLEPQGERWDVRPYPLES
ncbi:hypothetical protein [Streptomyces afghaniensis]|uniref:hypothetical protein n=1 Tax=Streptomyces afghaniensis TaxID=66865 RepID=UPI0027862088|nr:hypothetical protein [Streptomyces afghaniensis]MDQ1013542.1 hypothetical protein [Streptomyces afghaniensis]